jgi:hypothetical protein
LDVKAFFYEKMNIQNELIIYSKLVKMEKVFCKPLIEEVEAFNNPKSLSFEEVFSYVEEKKLLTRIKIEIIPLKELIKYENDNNPTKFIFDKEYFMSNYSKFEIYEDRKIDAIFDLKDIRKNSNTFFLTSCMNNISWSKDKCNIRLIFTKGANIKKIISISIFDDYKCNIIFLGYVSKDHEEVKFYDIGA